MDTKSDSLAIICTTLVLYLCQVLHIDFGSYYLMWIAKLCRLVTFTPEVLELEDGGTATEAD